jgi:hypothetical protein
MGLLNTCAKCGCEDNFLTTPPPCPTAIACPTEECSAVQYAKCIAYTGSDIECNNDIVVPTDTNMAAAINNIVDYFCTVTTVPTAILCDTDVVVAANTVIVEALADTISYFCSATTVPAILDCNSATVVAANTPVVTALGNIVDYFCNSTTISTAILCNTDTVVATGTTVTDAIENVINYFCDITTTSQDILCGTDLVIAEGSSVMPALLSLTDYFCAEIANLPTTTVVGGTGISVTSNTVGTNTAYTVNATGVKKYVDTLQSFFGAATHTILGSDLIACGLLQDPACSNKQTQNSLSDLFIRAHYKPNGATNWNSLSIVTPGTLGGNGLFYEINPTTGNILFTFNLPPLGAAADVRIVILG